MTDAQSRWLKRALLVLAAIILVVDWVKLIPAARNDFRNHYVMGQRLARGTFIYEGGLNYVYPPFWALAHAPFTIVSDRVAMLLLYPFGVAAMVGLGWILKRLADRHWPVGADDLFWSMTAAVLLASPFLERDLGEVGVNSFLVMLSWLGIYLWLHKQDVPAGISIGLAAALKCTPVIFIAYFFFKRQWKIAITGSLAMLIFSLSPILVMGSEPFQKAIAHWKEGVKKGVSDPDPSRGVLGEEKVGNLSLRPALARYLMHLPYDHLGRPETSDDPNRPSAPEDPLYVQFLNLSPTAAGWVVKIILLIGALLVAWMFRGPAGDRSSATILWECTALSLVILIYSPVTWRQHCVGVLPALYFLWRSRFTEDDSPRWLLVILGIYFVLVVLLQREVFGARMGRLFDAYRVKTLAIVLLCAATLAMQWLSRRHLNEHLVESGATS